MTTSPTLNYRDAGVNITAGDQLVERIKPFARRTHRPEVLGGLGGFSALFALPLHRYQEPVLVSGTDGVGTKLRLALAIQQHQTIGIDLVAMCVNDVLVCGAEPLFFLDYYATGALDVNVAAAVIEGIAHGCQQAGAALVGGETAEMPGMYHGNDYDLAGFCVGIVERSRIIDGNAVQVGDTLIALASSGPHSNGYSLIRKVIEVSGAGLHQPFEESSLGTVLLTPTRIYVQAIRQLLQQVNVRAMAHITGGGLTENIPRVLPAHTKVVINTASWTWPAIFSWLQEKGGISTEEMRRTFNCGVGFVIAVSQEDVPQTLRLLQEAGETAWVIGHIAAHDETPRVEYVGTAA